MSSIYDALKRSQTEKQLSFPMGPYGTKPSKKWYWVILGVILFSSICTMVILYSIGMLGPEEKVQTVVRPAQTAQVAAPAVKQTPVRPAPATLQNPMQESAAPQPKESRQAASLDPDHLWDLMRKAEKLHQKGDLEGAIQAYNELITLAPNFIELKINLGGLYYEDKQYDLALDIYKKALAAAPGNAKLMNNIGSVLLAKNEVEPALKYFIQAHRISSDYVEPLYNMACAYARLKKNGAALSSLRQACIMQPEARLWAKRDPDLKPLRGDKEFEEIVRAQ
jgi:tetratricopeptide (TPR) repeat protein